MCIVPVMWNDYRRISFRGRYEDGLRTLLNRLSGMSAAAPTPQTPEAAGPTAPAIAIPAAVRTAPTRGPIDFDWVTIPAGDFLMGSDKKKDKLAYDDETPQHTLYLPEYRIARVPVTVTQFAKFVEAAGYKTTAEQQGSAWSWTGSKWGEVKGADWAHPAGRRATCGRSRIIPSRASRGTTLSRSAGGLACGCPPRPNGRGRPAAPMAASGRGGISRRTTGSATSTAPWGTQRLWAAILMERAQMAFWTWRATCGNGPAACGARM